MQKHITARTRKPSPTPLIPQRITVPCHVNTNGSAVPGGGAATSRGGGVLGIHAKCSAAPRPTTRTDPETGEILGAEFDPRMARFERFALQAAARSILPQARVAKCLRARTKGADIQVIRSKEHGKCSYKGLQTCGSVWTCPVCAAKISERRRLELQAAIESHRAAGGQVLLLTLTNPHAVSDNLYELLARQAVAMDKFNTARATRKILTSMGYIGQIRAAEVTHGRLRALNNGWHPHFHILLFVASGLDLVALRLELFARWEHACLAAGLKAPSLEHGLRLDDGSKAAKYASKWGLESEMTKGHVKKSTDGETPFDLLRAYLANSDKQAAALFFEFAACFKGKRQLHWSSRLKKHFHIGELTDEELAHKQDDKAVLLGTITLDQWRAVLRKEARSLLLDLAEQGWEAVTFFLDSLPTESVIAPGEPSSKLKEIV